MRKEYILPAMRVSYFGDNISTTETNPVNPSQYAVDAAKNDLLAETFQSNPQRVAVFEFTD